MLMTRNLWMMPETDILSSAWGYQIGVGEKVADFTKRRAVFSACAGASIYRKEHLG